MALAHLAHSPAVLPQNPNENGGSCPHTTRYDLQQRDNYMLHKLFIKWLKNAKACYKQLQFCTFTDTPTS